METKESILVIGSGVIGMTTALCLAQTGYPVTIATKESHASTTSATAAALWLPFAAEPKDKVSYWAEKTLQIFQEMKDIDQVGIIWQEFSELLLPECELPWWHNSVDGFWLEKELINLPVGKRQVCHYTVPIIDTSLYLNYLERLLLSLNVSFIFTEFSHLDQAFELGNTVINCSGIGAITLANDLDLHPARGQVVRIKRKAHHVPIVDLSLVPKFAHITPRFNDTVIGGTYEEGVFDLEPNADEVSAIISRCQAIFPQLGEITPVDVINTSCGLRPVRSSVRVAEDFSPKGRLFHNYGHGGAGYTLSWGCAEEIRNLVHKPNPVGTP